MKLRTTKTIHEWTSDIAKKWHPYSKNFRAVDWYAATGGKEIDDVNVEWSRAFDGYSNDHFTPASLSEFYQAAQVKILADFSIAIYDAA